jgi:hypothetical protein
MTRMRTKKNLTTSYWKVSLSLMMMKTKTTRMKTTKGCSTNWSLRMTTMTNSMTKTTSCWTTLHFQMTMTTNSTMSSTTDC